MKVVVAIFSEFAAWNIPESEVARLRHSFPGVTFVDVRSDDELLVEISDADVAYTPEFRPALLAAADRLQWIHSSAAGVGNMLFDEMLASDVTISNSRGIHSESIAEHVLCVTILLRRRVHTAIRRQIAHEWSHDELSRPPLIRVVRGSTMGVIGLGGLGTGIAELARLAGMRVIAMRRRADLPRPSFVDHVYGPAELHVLLGESDVVTIAAPLTPSTRALIGAAELRQMRPDAVLINVARGKLVDEAALVHALRTGIIGGAALDVFEHEPLAADSPLWDLANVVITPHTAGLRPDYFTLATDLFIDNLHRYLAGQELRNVVDKTAGY